jgi:hypothetical protein
MLPLFVFVTCTDSVCTHLLLLLNIFSNTDFSHTSHSLTTYTMTSTLHNMLNPWSAEKIPNLTGRVAVVTGGNEGIAAAFITECFKHGLEKVIILSNDAARHESVSILQPPETIHRRTNKSTIIRPSSTSPPKPVKTSALASSSTKWISATTHP